MREIAENFFLDPPQDDPTLSQTAAASAPPVATEEVILRIPGAILNLIDQSYSMELACGDLAILRIVEGENVVAVLARVADEIQWPLIKDEAAAKVDESHYFFSLRSAKESGSDSSDEEDGRKNPRSDSKSEDNGILNYGLTIVSKGQESLLKQLDGILTDYVCFTVQQVSEKMREKAEEILDVAVVKETSPAELKGEKKEIVEKQCAAYWTALAPNVEDYSRKSSKLIASGQLIKGIFCCEDVTMVRLKWENDFMKRRMTKAEEDKKVSRDSLKGIKSKKIILSAISKEIEKGFVEEQNLERLEILEKILEEEGSVLPESMKEAYCQVAVECAVRFLVCAEGASKSYTEAIRRIWRQRIMSLCQSQSRLVTSDVKDHCLILQTAICDQKARESLIKDNTRNKALLSLKRLVSDPLLTGNSSSCDTSRVSPEIVQVMAEAGEEEIALSSGAFKTRAHGREIPEEDKIPISSPIFDRVVEDLKVSVHGLLDALRKVDAPALNNDETSTEQKNASANHSAVNNSSKPSMMERDSTTYTYEWGDSFDGSIGESSGHGRQKLERKGISKGARRLNVPWDAVETLAVLEGYEKHGPRWMQIKAENPILLARRTNIDIKDRFRTLKKREKARQHEAPRQAAQELE